MSETFLKSAQFVVRFSDEDRQDAQKIRDLKNEIKKAENRIIDRAKADKRMDGVNLLVSSVGAAPEFELNLASNYTVVKYKGRVFTAVDGKPPKPAAATRTPAPPILSMEPKILSLLLTSPLYNADQKRAIVEATNPILADTVQRQPMRNPRVHAAIYRERTLIADFLERFEMGLPTRSMGQFKGYDAREFDAEGATHAGMGYADAVRTGYHRRIAEADNAID